MPRPYGVIAVVRILAPWLLRQVGKGRIGATLTTSTGAELAEAQGPDEGR